MLEPATPTITVLFALPFVVLFGAVFYWVRRDRDRKEN